MADPASERPADLNKSASVGNSRTTIDSDPKAKESLKPAAGAESSISGDAKAQPSTKPTTDKMEVPNLTSNQAERPDILFCLTVKERGKPERSFYKDAPWKGINNGLPGSDADDASESRAVLVYTVEADVTDKTQKPSNTSLTWREQPSDFEFGRDALLDERHSPSMQFYSKRLIKVLDDILDYYPFRDGTTFDSADAPVEDTSLKSCIAIKS